MLEQAPLLFAFGSSSLPSSCFWFVLLGGAVQGSSRCGFFKTVKAASKRLGGLGGPQSR